MNKPVLKKLLRHFHPTDVRSMAQLATAATIGVTEVVEGVHQSVLGTLGLPGGPKPGQTRGLTGLVYRSVYGLTHLVGNSLDQVLATFQQVLDIDQEAKPGTPEREAVLAALNGVIGDRLAINQSALATPMRFHYQGQVWQLQTPRVMAQASGKIVLMLHGLCMNDLQWHTADADHGAMLAEKMGWTPLYLRYNTGMHISQNGRQLTAMLETLLADWPTPVTELNVLAHSMGGLLIRSALHQASVHQHAWPARLKRIVFLGTPHHGAPLEKAGNWVDLLLGSTPYSKPFAKLAQLRSPGITDLRFGLIQDADWYGKNRFQRLPDERRPLPLPDNVACFAIAATLAGRRSPVAERLLGDGLVPVHSALGIHEQADHTLAFPKAARAIMFNTHHMALLSSTMVGQQILQFMQSV